MFLRTADVLTAQTQAYWKLSGILNGKSKQTITVAQAIKQVNDLEYNLGPHRPLLRKVKTLGSLIVEGSKKPPKKLAAISASIHILQFVAKSGV